MAITHSAVWELSWQPESLFSTAGTEQSQTNPPRIREIRGSLSLRSY